MSAFDVARSFDEHAPALLGFAINALQDRALAEDCVQETFLRAWRGRDGYDPDRASERTWLFAIGRHVVVDAMRTRSRLPHRHDADATGDIAVDEADPLERLRLAEAMALLSEPHRAVVVAVHVEGRSYAEVAAVSGIPVPTLRTRAFHALRALRRHMAEEGGADGR